ncbi:MAG: hypothetical protein A2666_00125 [Parcubacteria group bacterium RIFCSPHIGHO2_01_FULL_47_10b]|nr:MAG: hypothetical protein A2666_00125 [Parcubacteria group bacterium RIFCSPHIGHO2_01_FULL_47_10b]
MDIMTFVVGVAFVFGAHIGSFVNVVALRLHTGEPIARGRSHCADCRHVLEWFELVPLVSYLVLRGRCLTCKKTIAVRYFGVEVVMGILFAAAAGGLFVLDDPLSWLSIALWFVVIAGLGIIFLYDLDHYLIPNVVLYPLFVVTAIGIAVLYPDEFLIRVGVGFSAALFFYIIHVVTKGRGMGLGDVKFSLLIGVLLGPVLTISAMFVAFVSGAAVGLVLIARQQKQLSSQIPFGPFLVGGTLLIGILSFYFDISQLMQWYMY